jgi:hypothetical protein
LPILRFAVRADLFREHVASNSSGTASSIFWPVPWVGSGTATIELQPHDHVIIRLEGRHDQAAGPLYFDSTAVLDDDGNAVPTSSLQDTITLGATTWF